MSAAPARPPLSALLSPAALALLAGLNYQPGAGDIAIAIGEIEAELRLVRRRLEEAIDMAAGDRRALARVLGKARAAAARLRRIVDLAETI